MVNKLRKMLKSEKGFTLVELLAVIVILGIIAAIAVPAVGNIIENTKKDAHRANAMQMIESSRLAYASGVARNKDTNSDSTNDAYTLQELVDQGYLEAVPEDPEGSDYDTGNSFVIVGDSGNSYTVTLTEDGASVGSYVDGDTISDLQTRD